MSGTQTGDEVTKTPESFGIQTPRVDTPAMMQPVPVDAEDTANGSAVTMGNHPDAGLDARSPESSSSSEDPAHVSPVDGSAAAFLKLRHAGVGEQRFGPAHVQAQSKPSPETLERLEKEKLQAEVRKLRQQLADRDEAVKAGRNAMLKEAKSLTPHLNHLRILAVRLNKLPKEQPQC